MRIQYKLLEIDQQLSISLGISILSLMSDDTQESSALYKRSYCD